MHFQLLRSLHGEREREIERKKFCRRKIYDLNMFRSERKTFAKLLFELQHTFCDAVPFFSPAFFFLVLSVASEDIDAINYKIRSFVNMTSGHHVRLML